MTNIEYAALARYCDELKRVLRGTVGLLGDRFGDSSDMAELRDSLAKLLASDPRNPERLEARATPKSVPRGHCNRCDRCGWPLAESREGGCVLGNCSQREGPWQRVPDRRTNCPGCGALYDLEADKERADEFARRLKEGDEPQETMVPDPSGLFDEESWK